MYTSEYVSLIYFQLVLEYKQISIISSNLLNFLHNYFLKIFYDICKYYYKIVTIYSNTVLSENMSI